MPTSEEFDQYAMLRQRFEQFLRLSYLWIWVREERFAPPNPFHQGPELFSETLRAATLGWLASLVDKRRDVVSAFRIWPRIFPHIAREIEETRLQVEGPFTALRDFRGSVAFHSSRKPEKLQEAKLALEDPEVMAATERFMALGVKLLGEESKVPGLGDHLRRVYALAFYDAPAVKPSGGD